MPTLLGLLDSLDPISALTVAESVLHLAFSGPIHNTDYDDLNPLQQRVLYALCANRTAWTFNASMSDILRTYNLPYWPEALRRYVTAGAA